MEFGELNPRRVSVARPGFVDKDDWACYRPEMTWVVVVGDLAHDWYATHAEAVVAADKLARRTP